MITIALIALGGATGAMLRATASGGWKARGVATLTDRPLADRPLTDWPLATMALNTMASFVLAVFADASAFITIGVLGALSTWSTLALELLELGRQRSAAHALGAGAASLVAGIGAAWLGLVIASSAL